MKYIAVTFLRMMFDSKIPLKYKLLPTLAVLYVISPFDFLPDFIPMIGWADDLLILILAIVSFIILTPKSSLEDSQTTDKTRQNRPSNIYDGEYRVIEGEEDS